MTIVNKRIKELKEYENNPRHNEVAIEKVAASIREFGFKVPIVIDSDNVIIAGHTRKKAAEKIGLAEVPCIVADDLTPEQVKAFRLADNKVSEFATWDFEKLEAELADLSDFDMSDFGFDVDIEEDFDESDLDDDTEKENVIVSVNCNNVNDYEEIKERLQNLADEVNATVSVKMA